MNFYLALGDLSYSGIGQEAEWCDIVKSYLGPNFPFELVSGFHDDGQESPPNNGGLIDSYANCLPSSLAACVIATLYREPVRLLEERVIGDSNVARFSVGQANLSGD